MRQDVRTPADLTGGPLFTHAVFVLGPDHHRWYHRYHHLIMDGRALVVLVRRVAALYGELTGGPPAADGPLEPLGALLEAERAYRASPDFGRDRAYWLGVLAGLPDAPGAHGRGGTRLMAPLARHAGHLDGDAAERLRSAARALGTGLTELMIVSAAVHQHGVTGERDIVIGLPVLGLPDRRRVFAPATTANNLPIRLRIDRDTTVADLVRQTNTAVHRGLRHQRYRYEDALRESRRGALCDLYVNVMAFDYPETFGGCAVTGHNVSTGAIDGARIDVYDRPGDPGFRTDVDVNLDVHEPAAAQRIHRRILAIADRLAAVAPGRARRTGAPPGRRRAPAPARRLERHRDRGPGDRPLRHVRRAGGEGTGRGGRRVRRGPADVRRAGRAGEPPGAPPHEPRHRARVGGRGGDEPRRRPDRGAGRGVEGRCGLPADRHRLSRRPDQVHAGRQPCRGAARPGGAPRRAARQEHPGGRRRLPRCARRWTRHPRRPPPRPRGRTAWPT
nr:condensation domain-containing protein [Actinomadura madurae]